MRKREMSLEDYDIPIGDAERLYWRCLHLVNEDAAILMKSAQEICGQALAETVFESLTEQKGYFTLAKEKYIPLNRNDFYAYRRKTLARFYQRLCFCDMWVLQPDEIEKRNEVKKSGNLCS